MCRLGETGNQNSPSFGIISSCFTNTDRDISYKQGGRTMPKDSQPDNKQARMEKCNGQTPITKENQNKNPNAKRQPAR